MSAYRPGRREQRRLPHGETETSVQTTEAGPRERLSNDDPHTSTEPSAFVVATFFATKTRNHEKKPLLQD